MKILIATALVPRRSATGERPADRLGRMLRDRDHSVEFLRLPFRAGEDPLPDMLVARTLEVTNTDHVIATGFPAQLLRHPRKSIWLIDDEHPGYRNHGTALALATEQSVAEATWAFAATWEDAARLGLPALIVGAKEAPAHGRRSGHLLVAADDDLELVFAGLSRAPAEVRLVVAGVGARSHEHRALAADRGLASRVDFVASEPVAALAGASSLVTVSGDAALAAAAARHGLPTVTVRIAGIASALVDEETGWLVDPFADELAAVFASIAFEPGLVRSRGKAARRREAAAHASWSVALDRVLA